MLQKLDQYDDKIVNYIGVVTNTDSNSVGTIVTLQLDTPTLESIVSVSRCFDPDLSLIFPLRDFFINHTFNNDANPISMSCQKHIFNTYLSLFSAQHGHNHESTYIRYE